MRQTEIGREAETLAAEIFSTPERRAAGWYSYRYGQDIFIILVLSQLPELAVLSASCLFSTGTDPDTGDPILEREDPESLATFGIESPAANQEDVAAAIYALFLDIFYGGDPFAL